MEKIFIRKKGSLLKKLYVGLALAAVMTFGIGVTAGAETGAFTVVGGVEGTDYSFASGVLTIHTSEQLTISTDGTTSQIIDIACDDKANIILDGVQISNKSNSQKGAVLISGGGDVNIILAEGSVNSLIAGERCAALQKDGSGHLTISGSGSLSATGGNYAAGIGGGFGSSASDITISGGVIDAMGGTFAAGIGGGHNGDGSNITISGGAVTANTSGGASIGGGYNSTAGNIVITGGSVLAMDNIYLNDYTCPGIGGGLTLSGKVYQNGVAVAPTNGEGDTVYLLRVHNPTEAEVVLDGVVYSPSKHPNQDYVYMYLTDDEHTISVGGVETDYFFNPDTDSWTQPGTEFVITGEGLKHGRDFIYPADTGILTILTEKPINIANSDPDTATDNIIIVADGISADITLDGVNISAADSAALEITENEGSSAAVTVTAAEGSVNTLVSTGGFAALQKEGLNGSLTISGSGRLIAIGGTAGIGGSQTSHITIDGAQVEATGGSGAGIGGVDGAVSGITIIGSRITAVGGASAAGIGAAAGTVADVTVNNSVVTASGGAAAIGGGSASAVSGVVIDGGSVKLTAGGVYAIGGSEQVTPANNMERYVYLLTVENPDGGAVLLEGEAYQPQRHSEDDPNLYIYLPAGEYVATVGATEIPFYFDSVEKCFKSPQLKVTGGKLGEDYSFNAGAITILSSTPLSIENFDKSTPATDTLAVAEGISADLTFSGVNISAATAALEIGEGGSAKLILTEGSDNRLSVVNLGGNAGISVDGSGWLEVSGGINGGSGSSFAVAGGSVTADSVTVDSAVIDGGSVLADISVQPVNSQGEQVYLLTIANSTGGKVYVDNAEYAPAQHGIGGDTSLYAYLTGAVHSVKTNIHRTYHFDSITSTFYLPDLNVYGDNVVYGVDYTYSDGVVTVVTSTPVVIENINPDAATTDSIAVAAGVNADITLNGVNIDSTASALDIAASAKVEITLAAGSRNYLGSAAGGISIGDDTELTLAGSGELEVSGDITGGSGSGITVAGGSVTANAINIPTAQFGGGTVTADEIITQSMTVNGGRVEIGTVTTEEMLVSSGSVISETVLAENGSVEVTDGSLTADILLKAADITLSGGSVITSALEAEELAVSGAALSADYVTVNAFTVTSGRVDVTNEINTTDFTAEGGSVTAGGIIADSADISGVSVSVGGKISTSAEALISGGSVTAAEITAGLLVISGGSVKADSLTAPVNAEGSPVYLLKIDNPDNKTILIDGEEFLPKQHSSTDSSVYAYLTGEAHTVKLGSEQSKTYIYDSFSSSFVVIGSDLVVSGGIYGLDYIYPVDSGVLTVLTDKQLTIANSAEVSVTSHSIAIRSGVSANLILNGVNISSAAAALAADGGNLTISCAEGSENSFSSAGGTAVSAAGEVLEISGGRITAGGNIGIAAAEVRLNSCVLTAVGGIRADKTVIIGGSVKSDSVSAPVNGEGNAVYLLKIANPDNKALYIDNAEYTPTQHGIGSDSNVYAYVEGKSHVVTLGDEDTVYLFDKATESFKLPDLVVTGSGLEFGTDYTYENGVLTILTDKALKITNNPEVTSTADRIVIPAGVSAALTLDGVNISTSPSVEINGNAQLTIAESGAVLPELLLNGTGSLEVDGTGVLTSEKISGIEGTIRLGCDVSADTLAAKALYISGGCSAADISAEVLTVTGGNVEVATISATESISISDSVVEVEGTLVAVFIDIISGEVSAQAISASESISISDSTVEVLGAIEAEISVDITESEASAKSVTASTLHITDSVVVTDTANAGDIIIDSCTVTANAITAGRTEINGGSVKAESMPEAVVNSSNANVYLLVIENPNGESLLVDGGNYQPAQHSDSVKNVYAYLTAEDHTVSVGSEQTTYRYSEEKGRFLIVPTADMFDVQLPAELTYDGSAKTAAVTPADSSISYIVKYYDENGDEVTEAVAAGIYTFEITVIGDDIYAEQTVSSNDWSFTITGAQLEAPESLKYTVGYGYKAEDAVQDMSTGVMNANGNAVTGTWSLEDCGNITESRSDYSAVFTPGDKNFISFTFTSVQIDVFAVDPVITADPEAPRVIPGKSVTFAIKAEHPKYPEFTEGLPTEIISVSDGATESSDTTYTVDKNAEIGSTINITVKSAAVEGKYNSAEAAAVITVAEKLKTQDVSVDTADVIYGSKPQPEGVFGGDADGEAMWSFTYAVGDVGEEGSFGSFSALYNEDGALDVGVYTVRARYEDAMQIGYGYGTFRVTPRQVEVAFVGDISKQYDGTKAVVGYTADAADFRLSGLVGETVRYIDTLGVTILYKDEQVGSDKELIIAIVNNDYVVTADGSMDGNYTVPDSIDFVGAVIERRSVTATADNASKTFGESDPAFTYTAENLVNGEALIGELTREEGEDAGEYSITQGTLTNRNNANYDITFIPAVLTISKAAAPTVAGIEAWHSWGAYGNRSMAVTGLPADMGELLGVSIQVDDPADILGDSVQYADGSVTYSLNTNQREDIGSTATMTLTVSCRNYEDFNVTATVTLTAKQDRNPPEIELTFKLNSDATFTATITAVEGAEYRFGDGEWTSVNYITGVPSSTYVTAYIRMAETETHNASAAASVTQLSPKSTVATPVFNPAPQRFSDELEIRISCETEGATIYYTINGKDPLKYGTVYTAPFMIYGSYTVKAIAVKESMLDSEITVGVYEMNVYTPPADDDDDDGDDDDDNGGGGGNGGDGDDSDGGGVTSGYGETPAVGGKNHNWHRIAQMIEELPIGGGLEVQLNGCTEVPDFVIKAIANRDAHITFEYSSLHHWYVDGKDISDEDKLSSASLNITYPIRIMTYELRGKAKLKFRISNTNLPCVLDTDADVKNAGEFINLYKYEDEKLVFVECARIDENGIARLHSLNAKGDYVMMLCRFSDLSGDVNNDGRVNALDAAAILRHIVQLEEAPNIEMGDFTADGSINAMDAGAVLSWIVGA